MQDLPVSPQRWRSVINGPTHNIAVLGQVFAGDDPDEVLYDNLPINGGQVTVDGLAAVRRTLDLELVDDDRRFAAAAARITPGRPGDLFSPYGSMVRIQYGVEIPGYAGPRGDAYAWFDQGWFRISTTDAPGDGLVKIGGSDLSRTVSRSAPIVPYVIPAGTLYTTAILNVIAGGLPAKVAQRSCVDLARVTASTETTPLIVLDAKADRWAEAQRMAKAIGYRVYFGEDSGVVLEPVPDVTSRMPVARYVEGQTALLAASKSMTDDPGYNGVVLDAEASTLPAPLRSVVWDANPDSATYHLGPYGEVPYFMSSPYVATQAQADAAARAELLRRLSLTDRVQVSIVPDPAVQPDDVSEVVRQRSGINAYYRTDRLVLPFDASTAMPLTCRPRTALNSEDT